jgi:hypothetical protein
MSALSNQMASDYRLPITESPNRIDLLFTMSDTARAPTSVESVRIGFFSRTSPLAETRAPPYDRPPGGARRDRTDDLLLAKQALSQLSYGPFRDQEVGNQ